MPDGGRIADCRRECILFPVADTEPTADIVFDSSMVLLSKSHQSSRFYPHQRFMRRRLLTFSLAQIPETVYPFHVLAPRLLFPAFLPRQRRGVDLYPCGSAVPRCRSPTSPLEHQFLDQTRRWWAGGCTQELDDGG